MVELEVLVVGIEVLGGGARSFRGGAQLKVFVGGARRLMGGAQLEVLCG